MIFNENGEILQKKNKYDISTIAECSLLIEQDYKELNSIMSCLNESVKVPQWVNKIIEAVKKAIKWVIDKIEEIITAIGRKIRSLFAKKKISEKEFVEKMENMTEDQKEEIKSKLNNDINDSGDKSQDVYIDTDLLKNVFSNPSQIKTKYTNPFKINANNEPLRITDKMDPNLNSDKYDLFNGLDYEILYTVDLCRDMVIKAKDIISLRHYKNTKESYDEVYDWIKSINNFNSDFDNYLKFVFKVTNDDVISYIKGSYMCCLKPLNNLEYNPRSIYKLCTNADVILSNLKKNIAFYTDELMNMMNTLSELESTYGTHEQELKITLTFLSNISSHIAIYSGVTIDMINLIVNNACRVISRVSDLSIYE